ncbi:hypothetical protein C8R46DRAFT_1084035 [Mycena filopes]|nr:hypothetical protein C8R46DRAFT_1084035 [Mycena filopes]
MILRACRHFLSTFNRIPSSTRSFSRTMTSPTEFKQAPHKLLLIPGPIEVADEVGTAEHATRRRSQK